MPSLMNTDNSRDYRGRERAIFYGHWQFTGLQGKGEGHLSWTLTIHRTAREGTRPSFMDTDGLNDYRERERAIFRWHWWFTGLQGKREGNLSWILTIYMATGEGRGPSFIDTGNSQDHRGRERAIFHGHWWFTWLEGKGVGHLSWTLTIHVTTVERRGPSFMDTDDSQDCKGR